MPERRRRLPDFRKQTHCRDGQDREWQPIRHRQESVQMTGYRDVSYQVPLRVSMSMWAGVVNAGFEIRLPIHAQTAMSPSNEDLRVESPQPGWKRGFWMLIATQFQG